MVGDEKAVFSNPARSVDPQFRIPEHAIQYYCLRLDLVQRRSSSFMLTSFPGSLYTNTNHDPLPHRGLALMQCGTLVINFQRVSATMHLLNSPFINLRSHLVLWSILIPWYIFESY